jgi:hypothetical protein
MKTGFGTIEELRQRILGDESNAAHDRELMINATGSASSIEFYTGLKFTDDVPIEIRLAWLIQCDAMGTAIPQQFYLTQGCREWLDSWMEQNKVFEVATEFEPYVDPMLWLLQVEQSDELHNMIPLESYR